MIFWLCTKGATMKRLLALCMLLAPAVVQAQTLYTIRQTICVSAAEQENFNDALEARGFGPGNLSVPVISKLSLGTAPAATYCADWRMTAADEVAIKDEETKGGFVSVTYDKRDDPSCVTGKPTFEKALDNRGNKKKPPAAVTP